MRYIDYKQLCTRIHIVCAICTLLGILLSVWIISLAGGSSTAMWIPIGAVVFITVIVTGMIVGIQTNDTLSAFSRFALDYDDRPVDTVIDQLIEHHEQLGRQTLKSAITTVMMYNLRLRTFMRYQSASSVGFAPKIMYKYIAAELQKMGCTFTDRTPLNRISNYITQLKVDHE